MVETIDVQRAATPMEMFLLAAISRGELNTLYALKHGAGLEPGSIRRALSDLELAGLIQRSEVPNRGRRRRTLAATEAGDRVLATEWKSGLDPTREMESILRGVTLALWMKDVAEGFHFLHRSEGERQREEPREFKAPSLDRGPADFHAGMRAEYMVRRRAMEAVLLHEFSEILRKEMEEKTSGR